MNSEYVGRFAPSPTGQLHMGSLLAAVASYLDAKSQGGKWLLRIEDVDRPRVVPGAATDILETLERFGFEWDGPVEWQSQNSERYQALLDRLRAMDKAFLCHCSRKEIQAAGLQGVDGARYPGTCRDLHLQGKGAWRVRIDDADISFDDRLQGRIEQNMSADVGDFVLLRADGCWTYQLAVIADDYACGVNHIVRGADLLDSTPRQIWLQQLLGFAVPHYLHVPVITNEKGQKLSKQTLAPALLQEGLARQLGQVFSLLGILQDNDVRNAGLPELWAWAFDHWQISKLPKARTFSVAETSEIQHKIKQ